MQSQEPGVGGRRRAPGRECWRSCEQPRGELWGPARSAPGGAEGCGELVAGRPGDEVLRMARACVHVCVCAHVYVQGVGVKPGSSQKRKTCFSGCRMTKEKPTMAKAWVTCPLKSTACPGPGTPIAPLLPPLPQAGQGTPSSSDTICPSWALPSALELAFAGSGGPGKSCPSVDPKDGNRGLDHERGLSQGQKREKSRTRETAP